MHGSQRIICVLRRTKSHRDVFSTPTRRCRMSVRIGARPIVSLVTLVACSNLTRAPLDTLALCSSLSPSLFSLLFGHRHSVTNPILVEYLLLMESCC
jgi:hypothetical protein